ncbi:cytochrome c-type biogenesis protein [Haemophilus aegyptius]|nr:cytochrome c-type biogenesis protein [Haemophilus aegyptius]
MLDQQLLIGTVFLAGLASFLSPCIFPIIPIYFGILSKGGKKSPKYFFIYFRAFPYICQFRL